MLALLAGTTTSPERKYPSVPPPSLDRQASRRRELGDRRAVSAVLNALLSIAGAGVATWWAAGRLAWRDEWVRPRFTFSCPAPFDRSPSPVPPVFRTCTPIPFISRPCPFAPSESASSVIGGHRRRKLRGHPVSHLGGPAEQVHLLPAPAAPQGHILLRRRRLFAQSGQETRAG